MLDTGAATAVCASDFIFMEHKALRQGGEVPHMKPGIQKRNYEVCIISDLRRLLQPYFCNRQAVIHTNYYLWKGFVDEKHYANTQN